MNRVAFTLIGGKNWTGGYNYLVNLVKALAEYEHERLQPVLFFGTDLDETYAGPNGTTIPGLRAIWCPTPNHPMFKEWAMVTWQRVAQKRGGQQIRHDAKWDFVRLSTEYVKTGIMVDPVAEGSRKKDGRRIQIEDLLATGTDGNLPFDICSATIYIPFPWPELRDRELFGWFLRMSERQIMDSDIAVKYLLYKSYSSVSVL